MGKRELHETELRPLVQAFLRTGGSEELIEYLIAHSNLPGRRGNLELAEAFGNVLEQQPERDLTALWGLCQDMGRMSAEEAPVNSPKEFLPFCAAVGMGAIGSVSQAEFRQALTNLKLLANDSRWRMREAVAMGLQRLLAKRSVAVLAVLEDWIEAGSFLELRAVAAAVAEPSVLKDRQIAAAALRMHRRFLDRVVATANRKDEEFRVLRKGLGYTLSVVVCALPQEGFDLIRQLVETGDSDLRWIVKQNLKKNRLTKGFPAEVDRVRELLS